MCDHKENYIDYEINLKTVEIVSQWLQDHGYEEASKAVDCEFEL